MMALLLSLFLFHFIDKPYAIENPCGTMVPRGYDEDWGMGVYYVPEGLKIDVYKDTLGTKFGTIHKSRYLDLLDINGSKIETSFKDIEWVGSYFNILLKVKNCTSEKYFNVFWKTSGSGYFIKKSDLEEKKAIFYLYKDLLFDTTITLNDRRFFEWAQIGINLTNHCLNLRKGPSKNADLIECIYGNDGKQEGLTHLKILEQRNEWAKVEVTTLIHDVFDDDCPSKIKSKRTGWLKTIDQSGFPNIWYSVSGY